MVTASSLAVSARTDRVRSRPRRSRSLHRSSPLLRPISIKLSPSSAAAGTPQCRGTATPENSKRSNPDAAHLFRYSRPRALLRPPSARRATQARLGLRLLDVRKLSDWADAMSLGADFSFHTSCVELTLLGFARSPGLASHLRADTSLCSWMPGAMMAVFVLYAGDGEKDRDATAQDHDFEGTPQSLTDSFRRFRPSG